MGRSGEDGKLRSWEDRKIGGSGCGRAPDVGADSISANQYTNHQYTNTPIHQEVNL